MPSPGFLRGALILALAGGVSRALGVFYVSVLPRVLSGEGYGLYTAVKPIYHALLILAVAGLPVAIAKLVADRLAVGDIREVRRVFWISIGAMLVTGSFAAVGLAFAAPMLATALLGTPDAALLLQAVAPAVLLLALASALRGYFQGLQRMTPIAVSQVSEQIARVIGTVVFAVLLSPLGVVQGAAGAMLGGVAGGTCALMVLVLYYIMQRRSIALQLVQRERPHAIVRKRGTLRQLTALALPLVLGQILWPVFEFLDTLLVPTRLMASGIARSQAMVSLGHLGMAGQLMWLPNVLTLALAASLVPAVAEAWAVKQMRQLQRITSEAIRVACLFGLPAAVGLYLLADQCAWLLFGFPQAGKPLAILAFGTVVIGLQQVTSGVLQGMGYVGLPVRNLVGGAVVKLVMNWWLVGQPQTGINGAAWGTLIGFTAAALLNYLDIRRLTGLRTDTAAWVTQPVIGCGFMTLMVALAYDGVLIALELTVERTDYVLSPFTVNAAATLAAIMCGAVAYGAVMLRVGGLRHRDVEAVPYIGPRWAAFLLRKGWVR